MRKSLSKRVTEILFLTSIGVVGCSTMPAVVYAQSHNNTAIVEKQNELKSTPKIHKIEYGDFYGETFYRFNCEEDNYINNVHNIKVNDTEYDEKNLEFSKHYYGIRIIPKAFKDGENIVCIKAKGYKDKVIKLKNDGTILSEEDINEKVLNNNENKSKFNINGDIEVLEGTPINLMSGISAKDEDGTDISKDIKVTCENLKLDNPMEGKYKAIYSVENKNGQTQSVERNVIVTKKNYKEENKETTENKLEDGIYTLGFEAYKLDSNNKETSMLGGFFDKNVKLEVKDGKMTLTMLNTVQSSMLYDFRIISNGVAPESICKGYGEANNNGVYEMQTFQLPISDITSEHVAGVLVSAMGGKKTDIGDMSKYKQVNIVFNKDIKKGWTGFQAAIKDDKKLKDKFEAVALNFDKDGDGSLSDSEYKNAKGRLNFRLKTISEIREYAKIKDISKLKKFGDGIKSVDLTSHAISELPEGVFDNLTNLESLNINCNKLTSLSKGVFDKLTNLKELNLNSNRIEELPEGIFDKLTKLETLTINKNKLKKLPDNIFNNLKSLDFLTLDENNIENIPKGIGNLKNLTWLTMDKNNITIIPKEMGDLKKLSRLTLSNNNIKNIADEFYNNSKNIEYLDLSNNLLTEIPKDLDEKLLKSNNLNFSKNKIDIIPSNIKKIVQTSEFRSNKLNFYPQKSTMNLTLKAEDGNISWNQDLSTLDFMYWSMYLSDKAETKEQYKKLVNEQLDEYKKSSDKSNFKNVSDLLKDKGVDWFITTEIQKKNSDGEYITIKKFEELGIDDPIKGDWKDSNMEQNNEYRIIKKAFNIKSSDNYIIVFSDEVECKADKVDIKPIEDNKNILKDIEVDILKENDDEPSMAGTYIKKVQYEVNGEKKYIRLNLNRSDWMKNLRVIVNGKEVNPEILNIEKNNANEENSEIRFETKDMNSKMQISMNVVPMNNALVSFRIVPKNIAKDRDLYENKEKETIEGSNVIAPVEDSLLVVNPNEAINSIVEGLKNTSSNYKINKDIIKEVKVKTLKENEDTPSMAGKYLEKASYENKDGHKYMRILLNRSDWMNNVKAVVDGKEIEPEILNIIKNESGEAKTEFRFPIKDKDSKIKLKMNVKPMNNALVTFRILPVEDGVTETNNILLKEDPIENLSVPNSGEENINTIEAFNNKQEDNVYKKDILPRTGSPIGASLGYLGALISSIGIIIKKKK